MNKELSDEVFENRIISLPGNILAYTDYKQHSEVDVILLHQHLGIQNYVRVMGQALINNQHSIIIPNLFGESQDQELEVDEEDNEGYIKALNHQKIAQVIITVVNYVAKRGNKVVLMGFSLGAAMGLKVLEYTDKVDFAFMFYGFPPLEIIRPSLVSALVTVFYGSEDKMKYMSSPTVAKKAQQLYSKNRKVQFIQMIGGKHGFINAACKDYDKKLFGLCCDQIDRKIGKFGSRTNRTKKNESIERIPKRKEVNSTQRSIYDKVEDISDFKGVSQRQLSDATESKSESIRKVEYNSRKRTKKEEDEGGCMLM